MSFQIGTALFNGSNSTDGNPIGSITGDYNVPTHDILTDGQNIAIAASSKHSVAVSVVSGSGTININGAGAKAVIAGESFEWTGSKLLIYSIAVACTTGKIVVTTIGPAPAV